MKTPAPFSFIPFRVVIVVLAALPLLTLLLALFGLGPAAELLATPVESVKQWFAMVTGLQIP